MIIALAMDDRFADNGPNITPKEFDGSRSENPTTEQMVQDWSNALIPERKLADIFPPIDIPKPDRVTGIGEDWFRRELQRGLNRTKTNLSYHGPINLTLEKSPNGNFQNQSKTQAET